MTEGSNSARKRGPGRPDGWAFLDGVVRYPGGGVVVGTGFVALDVVIAEGNDGPPRTWAGGTCGNVLTILAYLGWRSYPVASLGQDAAAERVVEDMTRFGVRTRFLRRDPSRRTPIVIERIRTSANGQPRSRFLWTCPTCGSWLPGYQPVVVRDAQMAGARVGNPAVFFFDRVSRGAIDLARKSAERGALVVFEPSGVRDEKLFREAVEISHVVKYSHERLAGVGDRSTQASPLLEIETLGREGLRYRLRTEPSSARWREMDAYDVRGVKDTVGAGDWCTAGLLHAIGARGLQGFVKARETDVENALRLGQALAAMGCAFEGARGGMYALRKRDLQVAIRGLLNGEVPASRVQAADPGLEQLWKTVCPACCAVREKSSAISR